MWRACGRCFGARREPPGAELGWSRAELRPGDAATGGGFASGLRGSEDQARWPEETTASVGVGRCPARGGASLGPCGCWGNPPRLARQPFTLPPAAPNAEGPRSQQLGAEQGGREADKKSPGAPAEPPQLGHPGQARGVNVKWNGRFESLVPGGCALTHFYSCGRP